MPRKSHWWKAIVGEGIYPHFLHVGFGHLVDYHGKRVEQTLRSVQSIHHFPLASHSSNIHLKFKHSGSSISEGLEPANLTLCRFQTCRWRTHRTTQTHLEAPSGGPIGPHLVDLIIHGSQGGVKELFPRGYWGPTCALFCLKCVSGAEQWKQNSPSYSKAEFCYKFDWNIIRTAAIATQAKKQEDREKVKPED